MKLFFYDLETTGLDCNKNGIHQISGKIVIDGETKEQVLAYEPMTSVYKKLTAMLEKYVKKYNKKDKFFLVGYNNAHFDNEFFREFFRQNGDKYFGSWFWSNCFDVMVLATPFLAEKRADMENFKLSTVAAALGIDVQADSLHDAMYDIELTHKIFDIVCKFS